MSEPQATTDLEAFIAAAPKLTRLLGIDLGTKTIGLALSDAGRAIASPLETLERGKFTEDAQTLAALVAKHTIGGIVVGLPLKLDGGESPRSQSTRAFAANLAKALSLPVLLWDERLSTVAVERALLEADVSRAKRAERIDKLAAAYILQGALDRLARLARNS
ncbi:MAG TPA: Holliday junction resolvase RuvX [Alphaproteobacteria bacterium]|nr:Holliday junction resolvase RuvX [Alphaproteobacteria bacterium]